MAKYSIYNTLVHRARVACTGESTIQQGNEQFRQPLHRCSFSLTDYTSSLTSGTISTSCIWLTTGTELTTTIFFMVVLYIRGLSKRFKKTYNSLDIQIHFKGSNTICTLLVSPKGKDNICPKIRVIYWFKCCQVDCVEHIGESGRTFGDRLREHLRAPSSIYHHRLQDAQSMWTVSPL